MNAVKKVFEILAEEDPKARKKKIKKLKEKHKDALLEACVSGVIKNQCSIRDLTIFSKKKGGNKEENSTDSEE